MGQGLYKNLAFLPPRPSTYERSEVEMLEYKGEEIPYYVARPRQERPQGYVILYSHGNAEDLGQLLPSLREMADRWNCTMVGYDYGGYGLASGHVSESRCYSDIEAIYEKVVLETLQKSPQQVILFGRSLGSGPTSELAYQLSRKNVPFAGFILQSPIESVIRVISKSVSYMAVDMFQNFKKVPYITAPTLIVHGTHDEVVPFTNGQTLAESSPNLLRFCSVSNAGHNDIEFGHSHIFYSAVSDFLDALPSSSHSQPPASFFGSFLSSSSSSSASPSSPPSSSSSSS